MSPKAIGFLPKEPNWSLGPIGRVGGIPRVSGDVPNPHPPTPQIPGRIPVTIAAPLQFPLYRSGLLRRFIL